MKKHFDPLRTAVAEELWQWIQKEHGTLSVTAEDLAGQLVEPPQAKMGDFAFATFPLAKILKIAPVEVAKKLSQIVPQTSLCIEKVEAVGPYLNIFIRPEAFEKFVLKTTTSQKLFTETPKTMIEYSQPNTHKELHVGHMRNASLGNALIRIHRYAGFEIISSTFHGDVGMHVAKCLWYLKHRYQGTIPQIKKGEWLGQLYTLANRALEDEGEGIETKQVLTEILQALEKKSGPYYQLWKETRDWSIELLHSVYEWAQIDFDVWYWESDVDASSVEYIKSLYQQGKIIESQGALGMDLEADGLGFCLLLKSDGTGLYSTKDVELAKRKFIEYKIEKSIYVVDVRQALHFKQVFKVLEKIGFEQAKNCFHLQYNFVELPDGAMSSRKGNIVPLMTLIEKMEAHVESEYLQRYKGEWTDKEIQSVKRDVARGAIKYGMLKIDNNKKIVFDMKEWLKIDGDSGPFIQYSRARIRSLCEKMNFNSAQLQSLKGITALLVHPAEKELMAHMLNFEWTISRCVEGLSPSPLCGYLFSLAKKFNHFYHECPMAQAETEALRQARLSLSSKVGEILENGLDLLGIPCPQRM